MTTINANTKISSLLKQHPNALEVIISLSPRFSKLRNPVLRKLMAARTSIATASKIGGVSLEDFFNKLKPLGFVVDQSTTVSEAENESKPIPEFIKNMDSDRITELDVRPVIEAGKDPLGIILQNVRTLETGFILKIINSFEPTPLIRLLEKQGFESYTELVSDELVNTYFYKKADEDLSVHNIENDDTEGWDVMLERFNGKLVTIDVRELEMPLPMHMILESLSILPANKALYVYHKRIPVLLLPELHEQKFNYRIKEINEGDVHLLIYKN